MKRVPSTSPSKEFQLSALLVLSEQGLESARETALLGRQAVEEASKSPEFGAVVRDVYRTAEALDGADKAAVWFVSPASPNGFSPLQCIMDPKLRERFVAGFNAEANAKGTRKLAQALGM